MSNRSDTGPLVEGVLSEAKWLHGLAMYLVRDRADADDMVQETWVATLRASPEPRASMRPWLAQVLRNVRRRALRGAARRRSREAGLSRLQEDEVVASTESMLARLELSRLVSETVRSLDEPYRTTLLLRFVEGHEPTEIARAQGVPAGTVRWRLSEGLERVRARLDDAHGGDRETWRAALLIPAAMPATAPAAGAPPPAGGWFSARTVAWASGGALVPVLVAGLLIGRPDAGATVAAPHLDPAQPSGDELSVPAAPENRTTTLLGVVLPALVAGADGAAAAPTRATAAPAPPACIPADNPAGCIETIPRSKLPAPVESTLARFIAGRKVDDLRIRFRLRQGHPIHDVKYEINHLEEDVEIHADGTFIESKIQLPPGDLPPPVAGASVAAYPDAPVLRADLRNEAAVSFYELDNGVPKGPLRHRPASRYYEIEVGAPEGVRKLEISEDGRLLKDKLK